MAGHLCNKPMELRIYLLGSFRVFHDRIALKLPPRSRVVSLWAYLCLHRDRLIPRAQLAYTLWPESTEKDARANLRRHLHLLRSLVPSGESWLILEGDAVQWHQNNNCWLDIVEFGQLANAPDRLEEAVSLYSGDLLENIYEDWVFFDRESVKSAYFSLLMQLVERNRQKRDYRAAITYGTLLLAKDPFREDCLRQLMSLYYMTGDRASALKMYDLFAMKLSSEIHVEPMPETTAIRELIKENTFLPAHLGRENYRLAAARELTREQDRPDRTCRLPAERSR